MSLERDVSWLREVLDSAESSVYRPPTPEEEAEELAVLDKLLDALEEDREVPEEVLVWFAERGEEHHIEEIRKLVPVLDEMVEEGFFDTEERERI